MHRFEFNTGAEICFFPLRDRHEMWPITFTQSHKGHYANVLFPAPLKCNTFIPAASYFWLTFDWQTLYWRTFVWTKCDSPLRKVNVIFEILLQRKSCTYDATSYFSVILLFKIQSVNNQIGTCTNNEYFMYHFCSVRFRVIWSLYENRHLSFVSITKSQQGTVMKRSCRNDEMCLMWTIQWGGRP